MKKIALTAMGAVLLATGAMGGADVHAAKIDNGQRIISSQYSQQGYQYHASVATDITQLPEYATVAATVDLSTLSAQLVEDNFNTRVILLTDSFGRTQYKTLFVKTDNRLKVIDYSGGILFDAVIESTVVTPEPTPPVQPEAPDTVKTPEEQALAGVDLTGYTAVVVEDNANKRTTLYKDANGHVKIKTLFMKRTGFVKVINQY